MDVFGFCVIPVNQIPYQLNVWEQCDINMTCYGMYTKESRWYETVLLFKRKSIDISMIPIYPDSIYPIH